MVEKKQSAESTVRNIRRKTRKKYSAEEKIRIVLDGLRDEIISAAADRMLNLHTLVPEQFFWRGREITIETEPDQPVWTDGEYQGRTPISMKVIPGGLPIVVAE